MPSLIGHQKKRITFWPDDFEGRKNRLLHQTQWKLI
jgi:hypothetical protein